MYTIFFVTEKPDKHPKDLQEVFLKTLSNEDCENQFDRKISKGMLCATTDYYDSCGVCFGTRIFYHDVEGTEKLFFFTIGW